MFDILEESVIMFKEGHPIYVNDMFLVKFRTLIEKATVTELARDQPLSTTLLSKLRCRRVKTELKFESSFFNEPMFTLFHQDQSQLGIRRPFQPQQTSQSLNELLTVQKE